MDFIAYQQTMLGVMDSPAPVAPYDDPHYQNYVRLNWARQERWLKAGILNEDLAAAIARISTEQLWIVITEPWCGDAAHTVPFIHRLSLINPLIRVDYQLRDSPPFLIDLYLTNGSKSIPKLIITGEKDQELAVWGPRPAACQQLFYQLVKDGIDFDQRKIELQKWYNEDKGKAFQLELLAIITNLTA